MQITYKDKVTLQSNPNIPDENKVTAKDMNEIKSVVNSNEEEQQALNMSVQEIAQNVVNNSQEISNIKEEQTTQNDNIQTNSNNISDLQSNKADKNEIPTDLSQLSNDNTKFVNETGLENAISQEKTQRQNADNNLQNQVDTNKTNIQTNATNIATNTQGINTIKAEQTTQNNRLNSLEVDNTTNKSDILTNKQEINNIKTEQTEQNTNISTNATNIESLQEENENLKSIVAQLPQVEGQGTSITLENTIEAPFTIFDVEGNSTQDGTPSPDNEVPILSAGDNENKFDKNNIVRGYRLGQNGANYQESGYFVSDYIEVINDTYTLSYVPEPMTRVSYYNSEKVWLTNNDSLQTFPSSKNVKYIRLCNKIENLDSIKLEKGNKASGYSPYGMGSINEKIQTSNLINIIRTLGTPSNTGYDNTNKRTFDVTTLIKFLTSNNYYNAGVQIDYSLTDNGIKITTKQAGYGIGFPVILNSAKTYTISANIDVIDNQMIRAIFYKEDGTYISNVTSSGTNKFLTFTTTDDTYFVVVMLTPKVNVETTYSNIMLNEGNTALPYVPHEEQDYSIPVQQPMRSIGDVRDGFAKVDGVWNEVHYIDRKIFNGTEGWSKQNTSSTSNSLFICWGYVTNPEKATACPNSYGVLSNYFKKVTENIWTGAYKGIDVYGNQAFICVSNEIASTVADFKTWLSTHNVEVNYVLKNPTYLPCTPEQIEVLENMPSTYKDFTIIQSQDETPAYLEVSGIYDLNKLITRTEVLESEV